MSEIKNGDRVHVEFDAEVLSCSGRTGHLDVDVKRDDGYVNSVLVEHCTVIVPPLPTRLGAVIQSKTNRETVLTLGIDMNGRRVWRSTLGLEWLIAASDPNRWEVRFEGVEP